MAGIDPNSELYAQIKAKLDAEHAAMDPSVRARNEQMRQESLRQLEEGDIMPDSMMAKMDFLPGLDPNGNLWPLDDRIPPASHFIWPTREDNLRAQAEAARRMRP